MTKLSDNIEESDSKLVIEMCNLCLGTDWKTLDIKRFSEGYFNKIFYCKSKENVNLEPVVVKLTLKEDFFLYNPWYSLVNTLTISDARLGPKVLSVFPGGLITEYIENRCFSKDDYENPKITRLLAQKLAKFHSLDSPVPKDGTKRWIYYVMDEYLEMEKSPNVNGIFDAIKKSYDLIKTTEYKSLKRFDISDQFFWIKEVILKSEKILVFSHCDFNRGNILIHENNQNLDIFFIDFDFSCYGYRGIDFGRYFSSWKQNDPNFGYEDYPTDQQMIPFIDAYIEECNRLTQNRYSKNKFNSREHIIKESKLFTLVGVLIDVYFCVWKAGAEPECAEEFLEKGDRRYEFYLSLKERFQKENSIDL